MGSDHVIARKMFGNHGRKQEGYEGNIRTRGGLLYYHEDAIGNIMDVTDRIGEQMMKYRYDAFGNLFTEMAAPYNAVGFTGKSYDAKAGLIDFGSRWYSPNEGRFTTMDTFPGWTNLPASLNRFSNAHNNPATYMDPSGHAICIPTGPDGEYCKAPAPGGGGKDPTPPPPPAPKPGSGGSGGSGGGKGESGGSGGSSGGSGGGGPVAPPPPPPPPVPTLAELIAMARTNYN
ncbi:RHS repeat-associated core domain-containing protein, partial [Bacillus sp. V3-13]|uniref:RHS repeat-associated core domain-containing protein n=1 Tax=Bacillus sp. V3-13 TaxID=2053728 RepID=UPI0015E1513B